MPDQLHIAGIPLMVTARQEAAISVAADASSSRSGSDIHLVNAYTIALADRDPRLARVLTEATINLADSRPLSLLSRWAAGRTLGQVRGPTLFEDVFAIGNQYGLRHFLLGSTPETLELLEAALRRRFPHSEIVGRSSPPFRTPTDVELETRDAEIVASGANLVWVGLGTPLQDFEVARVAGSTGITAVAVGAAFDFLAGTKKQAPEWMRALALEWMYRLFQEPRRLWRRYLLGNARFLWAVHRRRGDRPTQRRAIGNVNFSILTPSYNYAAYLPIALRSVRDQSRVAEHVVWDGESSDDTVKILESTARRDPDLLWRSAPDRGQSDALNKALQMSSGDVIGWLNADDAYLPGALSAIADVFIDNQDIDVVYGDVVLVDKDGKILRVVASYPLSPAALRWRGCVIPSTASFFRRSALGDGPWDPELRIVMDWDLYLRMHSEGRVFKHVPQLIAAFRMHDAQVTAALSSRSTREHQTVRDRWNASPRGAAVARLAGDVTHGARKVASGARERERATAHLAGRTLLAADGAIVQETWAQLRAAHTKS